LLNKIIYDIVKASDEKRQIGISDEGFEIIKKINNFSKKKIYSSKKIIDYRYYVGVILDNIYSSLSDLFDKYDYDFKIYEKHFINSYEIFGHWLETYYDFYKKTNADKVQILIDYMSGMSDNFAINFNKDISIPKTIFTWHP